MTRDMADLFRYDLWANKLWIETLLKFPEPERPDEVMTHILAAQWRWLNRLNDAFQLGLSLPAQPEAPSVTLAESLNAIWLDLLDKVPADKVLQFKRDTGEEVSVQFRDVATHVVNHGTYHRGHLRGLAEAQMVKEFPETDFVRWAANEKATTG
jgi:uncharacterized damage-inducible protein DinB